MPRNTTGPGPWLEKSETSFAKGQGWTTTYTYVGSEAECRGKQDELVALGAIQTDLTEKGNGDWNTRGTFPWNPDNPDGNYVDTIELENNMVNRSVYQSPVYRKAFSDYIAVTNSSVKADNTLFVIGDCVRKFQAGLPRINDNLMYEYKSTEYATRELAIGAELTDRLNQLSLNAFEKFKAGRRFISIIARGQTTFIEFQSVLRRTVTVGSPQAARANNTGAGQIWTTAELMLFEGISATGYFDLNPSSQWHKDKPRVISAYGQKVQISYTYTEIATASDLDYEAYQTAVLLP